MHINKPERDDLLILSDSYSTQAHWVVNGCILAFLRFAQRLKLFWNRGRVRALLGR